MSKKQKGDDFNLKVDNTKITSSGTSPRENVRMFTQRELILKSESDASKQEEVVNIKDNWDISSDSDNGLTKQDEKKIIHEHSENILIHDEHKEMASQQRLEVLNEIYKIIKEKILTINENDYEWIKKALDVLDEGKKDKFADKAWSKARKTLLNMQKKFNSLGDYIEVLGGSYEKFNDAFMDEQVEKLKPEQQRKPKVKKTIQEIKEYILIVKQEKENIDKMLENMDKLGKGEGEKSSDTSIIVGSNKNEIILKDEYRLKSISNDQVTTDVSVEVNHREIYSAFEAISEDVDTMRDTYTKKRAIIERCLDEGKMENLDLQRLKEIDTIVDSIQGKIDNIGQKLQIMGGSFDNFNSSFFDKMSSTLSSGKEISKDKMDALEFYCENIKEKIKLVLELRKSVGKIRTYRNDLSHLLLKAASGSWDLASIKEVKESIKQIEECDGGIVGYLRSNESPKATLQSLEDAFRKARVIDDMVKFDSNRQVLKRIFSKNISISQLVDISNAIRIDSSPQVPKESTEGNLIWHKVIGYIIHYKILQNMIETKNKPNDGLKATYATATIKINGKYIKLDDKNSITKGYKIDDEHSITTSYRESGKNSGKEGSWFDYPLERKREFYDSSGDAEVSSIQDILNVLSYLRQRDAIKQKDNIEIDALTTKGACNACCDRYGFLVPYLKKKYGIETTIKGNSLVAPREVERKVGYKTQYGRSEYARKIQLLNEELLLKGRFFTEDFSPNRGS